MNIIDLAPDNAWEAGADGYIIKYGQGGLEYDWRPHVARAVASGKPYGGYWVCDSRYSPEYHKAAIKTAFPTGAFGQLGLWLDIEKPNINMTDAAYRQTPYPYYKPVESIWRGVASIAGVYPGMYFGPGSWDLIMGATPLVLQGEFASKCECWIAHYFAVTPSMRGKWTHWAMWQWRGEPDYNRVDTAWWERVTGAPVPPPPPPVGDAMITATVNTSGLNFRAAPVSGATSAPALVLGDKVSGDLITPDNWLHVTQVNGVARVGYVAAWYLKDIVNTTPPVEPPVGEAVTGTISLNVNGAVYEGSISLPKK